MTPQEIRALASVVAGGKGSIKADSLLDASKALRRLADLEEVLGVAEDQLKRYLHAHPDTPTDEIQKYVKYAKESIHPDMINKYMAELLLLTLTKLKAAKD